MLDFSLTFPHAILLMHAHKNLFTFHNLLVKKFHKSHGMGFIIESGGGSSRAVTTAT